MAGKFHGDINNKKFFGDITVNSVWQNACNNTEFVKGNKTTGSKLYYGQASHLTSSWNNRL